MYKLHYYQRNTKSRREKGDNQIFLYTNGKQNKHIVFIYMCVASYTQYIKTAHLENKD